MKLLFLTKRYLTAKDIIGEEFGRYYELAAGLAALGWEVRSYCLDYRSGWSEKLIGSGGVDWRVYSVASFACRWHAVIRRDIRQWEPDVVLASSDAIHILVGLIASRLAGVPLAVDLHDNLESFQLTRAPGLRRGLRSGVRAANMVSCVSEPLRQKVLHDYGPRGDTWVLENAIPDNFPASALDRVRSRQEYELDPDACVVGIAGALDRKRGIEVILEGFNTLRAEYPELVLALAGPSDSICSEFARAGIRYVGQLRHSDIPPFLQTFDVGIVPNIQSAFAEYCYPQKVVELCALSVPFVAADFGVMRTMTEQCPEIRYQPGDAEDLARALRYQLEHRVVPDLAVNTWAGQADKLHRSLLRLLG